MNSAADDAPLFLGLGHALEPGEKPRSRVDVDQRHVEVALERLHHLRRLVLAEQAVVDEHAGELVADRLVHEQGGNRGVDATGEAAEHPLVADLRADVLDLLLDHGRRRPGGPRAGDAVQEVLQHLLPVRCVHDLGVELDAVQAALGRLECCDRRRVGAAGDRSSLRRRGHGVTMAHPGGLFLRQAGGEGTGHPDTGLAEFGRARPLDAAAEVLRHQLHAVADAEHGHAELVDAGVDLRGVIGVDGGGAAAEDQRRRVPRAERGRGRAVADELRVDAGLADPAGDQLRILAAQIDDEHGPRIRDWWRLRSGERQHLSGDSWAPPW